MKKAALIVIGDEILTGKVKDENSFVFANTMFERGVRVERIDTIPDDIETIADTVRRFNANYDYVCTSGGIGPTHDDRTLEAIAYAFSLPLIEHEQARAYFETAQEKAGKGREISQAQRKMVTFPESSQVYFAEPSWLPLIRVNKVYIFPGVPLLFKHLMHAHASLFAGSKFYREIIVTNRAESTIAHDLDTVQNQFKELSIGSYPQIPRKDFNVMVTIEGENEHQVSHVASLLIPLIDGQKLG